jgi:hypothetical protein
MRETAMTIEQCDRDAAADFARDFRLNNDDFHYQIRVGEKDDHAFVQSYSAHRLAERARCFAYIREQAGDIFVRKAGRDCAMDHLDETAADWTEIFTAMLNQIERTDNAL